MSWLFLAIVLLTVVLAGWLTIQIQHIRSTVEAVPKDGNVFAALGDVTARTAQLERSSVDLDRRLAAIEARLPYAVSRTGLVAYDAFGNITGGLSRSVAFLSERGDGIVFTVMVARDETLFYTKEIRAGRGTEVLSPEEQAAVDRAIQG